MVDFREPGFYGSDDSFSLETSERTQDYTQFTPLTPLLENFDKDGIFRQHPIGRIDDESAIVSQKLLQDGPVSSGPITVDYGEFSAVRQIITRLPPYGEFQIVTTYELSPLAGIVKEIEDVNKQILFYFSANNLLRDIYLRSLMSKDGYLSISIFSEFPRIKTLLPKLALVEQRTKVLKNAFRLSEPDIFEISGSRVRLRDSWQRWIVK